MLPLYAQVPRDAFAKATNAHIGLLFDKFPDGWAEHTCKLAENAKKDFLTKCIEKYKETDLTQNLTSALGRQRTLVDHLLGESLIATNDWRFISGLGAAHPYETGFIWHRTLSVPYIPGSSIKGMIRAWSKHWCELTDEETQQVSRLFGTEGEKGECGSLIIFDALPTKPPKLEIDILNPHYAEYYQDPANPPADYLSPIPVFFLTVAAGQTFEFYLAPRNNPESEQATQDLKTGLDLLKNALETLGAGGKTAVGYGVFTESQRAEKQCGAEFRAQQAIQLAQAQRFESLNPLDQALELFLAGIPAAERDARLLQELEKARWTGDDAKQVASKVKQIMEENGKWIPDFQGTNKQKLRLKERSLKVQGFLKD